MIGDNNTTASSRRPSQARIRKSINSSEDAAATMMLRTVTWCPTVTDEDYHSTTASIVEVPDHYDGIDKELIWYSRDELRMIRISNEIAIAESTTNHQQQEDESEQQQQQCCMRGLESWTEDGYWQRYQRVRDCINKVLDEQDRQKGIDRTHLGVVGLGPSPLIQRINHLHIPFDHERLAALCRDVTAKSRRVAWKKAKKDAALVVQQQEDQQQEGETTEAPEQKDDLEVLVQQPSKQTDDSNNEEETETVQTEASTIMISTDGEEEEDHSETTTDDDDDEEETSSSVPLEISHPATAESLKEKQRLRYQAYLLNRQARMIAKEQAEYQWEQRRMERRSSTKLYQDNQDCFAQLKQLQKHRVQCMSLMATVTM